MNGRGYEQEILGRLELRKFGAQEMQALAIHGSFRGRDPTPAKTYIPQNKQLHCAIIEASGMKSEGVQKSDG